MYQYCKAEYSADFKVIEKAAKFTKKVKEMERSFHFYFCYQCYI
jgi:hypothetical protein